MTTLDAPTRHAIGRAAPTRRPVNLRSVALGLLGVLFICGIAPFNDFVVKNTLLVGSFMPIGLLLFYLAVVCLLNAPLWKWRPRWALSAGELAVALGMTLVSCTLPGSGLMRFLPANLAALQYLPSADAELGHLLERLDLPTWMFPTLPEDTTMGRAFDPTVADFLGRIPPGRPETAALWRRAMGAWVVPAVSWGLLFGCVYGAVLFGSVIVRRQWAENERLAFPLAGVYLSVIEPPAPGHAFNAMFRSRSFLIAAGAVMVLHALNGLHEYGPGVWPAIPLGYDLHGIFANPPLSYFSEAIKTNRLFFSVIGITFFLQSQVAFSLWFFVVLLGVEVAAVGAGGGEFTGRMQHDEALGAMFPIALSLLWVGRKQWAAVGRRMVRRARADDPAGRYLPYGLAGWGFVLCGVGCCAWLLAAGASALGTLIILGFVATLYLVIGHVVAETGLFFMMIAIDIAPSSQLALTAAYGPLSGRTTLRAYFNTSFFNFLSVQGSRESLPPYAIHAMCVADKAAFDCEAASGRGGAVGFFGCLALALIVGYVTAGSSMLVTEYSYAASIDAKPEAPINSFSTVAVPTSLTAGLTNGYVSEGNRGIETRRFLTHFGLGAAVAAALAALRLRLAWWPFHPVGFLLACGSVQGIWFSIFLGWLAKSLLVRFGGGGMIRAARPFFLGLILGEAAAAAGWMLVSLTLALLGEPFHAVNLMPG